MCARLFAEMRERGGGGGGAMRSTWRLVTALLLFWGGVLVYMSASLFSGSDVTERTERQLQRAMQELDAIKSQNVQLQNLAAELRCVCVFLAHQENEVFGCPLCLW